MKREAFKMFLKPGFEKEYERETCHLAGIKKMLSDGGYMITPFIGTRIQIFCLLVRKLKGEESSRMIGANPIVQKWWDYMADIMEVNPDNSPLLFRCPRSSIWIKIKRRCIDSLYKTDFHKTGALILLKDFVCIYGIYFIL